MTTYYKYNDILYNDFNSIRNIFKNISFSTNVNPSDLTKLGIEIIEIEDPEPTLNELKATKKAEIAAARYKTEISGATIYGFKIATDRDSQALITGAALAAVQNSEYTLNWKTLNGFISLSSQQIIAIADLVRAHVQKCFDTEALACADIDAATSKEELDNITWKL